MLEPHNRHAFRSRWKIFIWIDRSDRRSHGGERRSDQKSDCTLTAEDYADPNPSWPAHQIPISNAGRNNPLAQTDHAEDIRLDRTRRRNRAFAARRRRSDGSAGRIRRSRPASRDDAEADRLAPEPDAPQEQHEQARGAGKAPSICGRCISSRVRGRTLFLLAAWRDRARLLRRDKRLARHTDAARLVDHRKRFRLIAARLP
jgi:hypothetical protein